MEYIALLTILLIIALAVFGIAYVISKIMVTTESSYAYIEQNGEDYKVVDLTDPWKFK
jgi:hypothetical protein